MRRRIKLTAFVGRVSGPFHASPLAWNERAGNPFYFHYGSILDDAFRQFRWTRFVRGGVGARFENARSIRWTLCANGYFKETIEARGAGAILNSAAATTI